MEHLANENEYQQLIHDDSMGRDHRLKKQCRQERFELWSYIRDLLVTTFGSTWRAIGRLEAILWNGRFELNIILDMSAPWDYNLRPGHGFKVAARSDSICILDPEADVLCYRDLFASNGAQRPVQESSFVRDEVCHCPWK